jgi:hypothetical protein
MGSVAIVSHEVEAVGEWREVADDSGLPHGVNNPTPEDPCIEQQVFFDYLKNYDTWESLSIIVMLVFDEGFWVMLFIEDWINHDGNRSVQDIEKLVNERVIEWLGWEAWQCAIPELG